ncbi:MAG: pyridine nucleotide-disulfide oxidoreductase [Nitrosopumilales archaeon CG15_BIG_FIL_POST_REV_8_21_14_020_33_23]|nr:MAG: pyridine nucleotide-disulfide oxidoreductase [Nitrosopumilales archaeon CG11_big_fil_rev_8_21_14_0_20_33_24]PIW34725.1 MAG: pyridine nucleotide-disulfide oxidoreductase [Nitrosopumilales archaeon CG15_BIG_FIL_POST_REV_8_21_14_020_33_23]PIY88859.1 MAG: pyridine nucleotide-disulfide oxidoreductase [Nitrosopumilales archaeon CG_4_10_14_0_8_um_filter_34_8]PJB98247.1 MAG: pyridine nucleotide-disulfide oxidoreductase [Nitrosopumilales archaeon CG_4_9_14_0_8_um_filter_34_10]
MTSIPHVLILGGGFGGLAAANEIRNNLSSSQAKITVIDKKDWFMVGFAKLWIIKGTRTFENSIGSLNQLIKKEINFLKEEILQIDLQNKNIKTTTKILSYDFLIIAMGAVLAPEKIPGLTENGMNLYDHNQLTEIHKKIKKMRSGNIAISIMGMPYKCPPAPFEASLLIDSMLRDEGVRDSIQIHFYSPSPITLPVAGPEISQKILNLINSENIIFHDSCKIKSIEKNKLIFQNGEAYFDLLLAVPPHVAPKVIYESGLAKEGGFIPINRDCKTPFENVYAVGDVTTLTVTDTMTVPKAGIFAEGEAIAVAQNIISHIQAKNEFSLFDGKGGCFIESGRDTASIIEIDMFSETKPTTKLTESTSKHLDEKIQFEKERFSKWL